MKLYVVSSQLIHSFHQLLSVYYDHEHYIYTISLHISCCCRRIFISYDGGGDNNDDGSNIGGDDGMPSVIG